MGREEQEREELGGVRGREDGELIVFSQERPPFQDVPDSCFVADEWPS